MRPWRLLAVPGLLFAMAMAAPAGAQSVAVSPRPDRVAVTVYRAPNRPATQAMDPQWLNGYALISETRTVTLPAGETEIRFEGVAGGIIPQSAIVSGFPEGVIERNHDAYLLSPASLLDRSLGRRVMLRRTDRATGAVREHEAVIRSGSGGAVVLQTPEGFEALRCSGGNETIVYPEVPAGLPARPTLSVRARSARATSATITLSYLATGFDWQANYVITLSPNGERADLFAWLTLASNDETSFVDADAQAVAGQLNREQDNEDRNPPEPSLILNCWPQSSTSDIPLEVPPPPPPPPSAPMPVAMASSQEIIVTGMRVARQEELGDLKLYRIPEPVTVASNSQKQVALLDRHGVRVRSLYRIEFDARYPDDREHARRYLVTRNRPAEGLGLPLPGGRIVVFAAGRERPLLVGEAAMFDRAVGEDIDLGLEEAPGISGRGHLVRESDDGPIEWADYRYTVTSDRPYPVEIEVEVQVDPEELRIDAGGRLIRRNGSNFWIVTIPANGSQSFTYRLYERARPNGN